MQPDQVWIVHQRGRRYRLTEQHILDCAWSDWWSEMIRTQQFDRLTHAACIADFVLRHGAKRSSAASPHVADLEGFRPRPLRASLRKVRKKTG